MEATDGVMFAPFMFAVLGVFLFVPLAGVIVLFVMPKKASKSSKVMAFCGGCSFAALLILSAIIAKG
jgi:peptidoglycan/LPS O-acetylase OafA/YrhL